MMFPRKSRVSPMLMLVSSRRYRSWLLACAAALPGALACSSPPSGVQGEPSDASPTGDGHTTVSLDAGIDAAAGRADIAVDMGRTQIDMSIAVEHFSADSCELDPTEQCVLGPGPRRVLRFSVETANLGDADLNIGSPLDNENYSYSQCHQHYHFSGYAQYRLLDEGGTEVVSGRKQAFCLTDTEPYQAGASLTPIYSCFHQGLQKGWVDVYAADLPCQLLDVTDIPDGTYQLEVVANPEGVLDDSSAANNRGVIAVTIGASALTTPTESCLPLSSRYLDRLERECDWDFDGEYACTPGSPVEVGCSQNCSLGSCTGDPMIRVCDAETSNCTSASALAANDNRCGGLCPLSRNFLCPASGRLSVYTAAQNHGQPYTCSIALATSGG